MRFLLGVWFAFLSIAVSAQMAIPKGTILPVQLDSSIRSSRARVGKRISARLMQDISLAAASRLPAGSKIFGRVVDVKPKSAASSAEMVLRFNEIVSRGRRIPVTTNLRALASMMDVADAQVPTTGPDRGTSEFNWTTEQIGGESVIHGGGPVYRGMEIVGHSEGNGVLAPVSAGQGGKCRGDLDLAVPQALWVFSSDACGIYDIPDLTLVHAGRSDPVGEIHLQSTQGDINLRSGSGLLLRVIRAE